MKTITKSCIRLDVRRADQRRSDPTSWPVAGGRRLHRTRLRREPASSANRSLTPSSGRGRHSPRDDRRPPPDPAHRHRHFASYPNGVEWNQGQKAHLVVAIAAQSDEHISLLRRLTRLMQQPERLTPVHAENPLVLIAALGDAANRPGSEAPPQAGLAIRR
jgi:hypothetical protein